MYSTNSSCQLVVKCQTLKILVETNFSGIVVQLTIVTHPLLEKVRLTIEADILHEVEGVLGSPDGRLTNLLEETIRHIFDVFGHLLGVHTDEVTWECIQNEILLNLHSLFHDRMNDLSRWFVSQEFKQLDGKFLVKTLITRNEFIGEAKTRHETPFL